MREGVGVLDAELLAEPDGVARADTTEPDAVDEGERDADADADALACALDVVSSEAASVEVRVGDRAPLSVAIALSVTEADSDALDVGRPVALADTREDSEAAGIAVDDAVACEPVASADKEPLRDEADVRVELVVRVEAAEAVNGVVTVGDGDALRKVLLVAVAETHDVSVGARVIYADTEADAATLWLNESPAVAEADVLRDALGQNDGDPVVLGERLSAAVARGLDDADGDGDGRLLRDELPHALGAAENVATDGVAEAVAAPVCDPQPLGERDARAVALSRGLSVAPDSEGDVVIEAAAVWERLVRVDADALAQADAVALVLALEDPLTLLV